MFRFSSFRLAGLTLAFAAACGAACLAQEGKAPLSNRSSNILPNDTHSMIAPKLPTPDIGPQAGPADYLQAARGALATGRTGEAQQALEMAETRALDRSTPLFQTNSPSENPLVQRIGAARRALGSGDRSAAMSEIDAALAMLHR